MNVRPALPALAAAGPYFTVTPLTDTAGWRPFAALCDPAVVEERTWAVRAALAAPIGVDPADLDERACASTSFFGTVARLVAPPLGTAAVGEQVPRLSAETLFWRPAAGGPLPIGLTGTPSYTSTPSPEAAATELHRDLIAGLVAPLVAAYSARFALSRQVLLGNVASALAGAATMLRQSGLPLALDPVAVVTETVGTGVLAGSGRYEHGAFLRNNCCLLYRLPGHGVCGDCVLPATPRRAADDSPRGD